MENNKKIENLVHEFKERVNENIIQNTTFESTGEFGQGGANCEYDIENDLYKLLFKLGEIIGNKDLQAMYKYTRTIEELVEDIENSYKSPEIYDEFDFVEEIDDDEHGSATYIVKYKPTGKFYKFVKEVMFSHEDETSCEFIGEVKKEEIKTYEWVKI